MKRLIEQDIVDEANESKGARFKKTFAKVNENPKTFENLRTSFILERMQELSVTP